MSSIAKVSRNLTAPGAKSKPARKPNAVRQIMEREQRARENSAAAAARTSSVSGVSGTARMGANSQCPNKACPNPNVVDGICQTCGRVADDSNIVSEVQFGETSSGAAIVQGSFLGADQGSIRPVGGPSFRRVAGSGAGEARERSLRDAKALMQQYVHRLNLSPALLESGFRLYRMAAMSNFVQGRRIANVVAICLYAACRKEQNCKIMLIDLADICRENVFKLGRNYKVFLHRFPDAKEGPNPIILEDLIWRFASKLEFYEDTNKVALSAVRIAHRMQKDHMTHGRRPAGICGAALIMAARAHSYRRTVREVVYIAKVTTHTLQVRMDEFANVPSAQMTIDEFHTNDFLDEQFDPPWWYKQSAAWKEKHQRPRKRKEIEAGDDADETSERSSSAGGAEKRQKTSSAEPPPPPPTPPSGATVGTPQNNGFGVIASPPPVAIGGTQAGSVAPSTDKDGFVIPPLPNKTNPTSSANSRVEDRAAIALARGGDGQLETLAQEFGDSDAIPERSTEAAMAAAMGIDVPATAGKKPGRPAGMRKKKPKASGGGGGGDGDGDGEAENQDTDSGKKLAYDEQWEADENALEEEMEVHLSNPDMMSVARDEAQREGDGQAIERLRNFAEERRVDEAIDKALQETRPSPSIPQAGNSAGAAEAKPDEEACWADPSVTPHSKISDNPIVNESEFADDPEVLGCLLGPEEARIKEQLWTNENKDWLTANQQKIFKKKMEARGPPKKTRRRIKTARIGEGQASPASSAGEAAVNALTNRAVSKKINYNAFEGIFDMHKYHRQESEYGGTSTAGSASPPSSRANTPGLSEDEDEEDAPRVDKGKNTKEAVRPQPTTALSDSSQALDGKTDAVETRKDVDEEESVVEDGGEGDYDEDQTGYYEEGDYPEEIDPFANNDEGFDDGDEWE